MEVIGVRDPFGPASDRQKKYAQDLGIDFPKDVTQMTLGVLITEAKQKLGPSDKQKDFARSLDIEFDDSTTASQLSKLMDAEIAKRSRAAISSNPALTAGEMIMHKGVPYKITFIGQHRGRWSAKLEPVFRRKGLKTLNVMVLTIADAKRATQEQLQRSASDRRLSVVVSRQAAG